VCVAANCQDHIHILAILKPLTLYHQNGQGQHKLPGSSHRMVDVPNQAKNVRGERHRVVEGSASSKLLSDRASGLPANPPSVLTAAQCNDEIRSAHERTHSKARLFWRTLIWPTSAQQKQNIATPGPLARRGTSILDAKCGTCNLTGAVCVRSTDMIPRILGCCRGYDGGGGR